LQATVEIVNHASTKANYAVTLSFLNLGWAVVGQAQGTPGYAIAPGKLAVLNLDSVIDLALNWTPGINCKITQVLRTASS
jgi:hypothetical protein